jgi:hypothetical protein
VSAYGRVGESPLAEGSLLSNRRKPVTVYQVKSLPTAFKKFEYPFIRLPSDPVAR